ncbi:hypothetical protein [Natrononativus amylolyticus]|uniref:hypothetical protein n=1 Tax=Natrononativus amylolyticus TaxID=2963434 RepID=UPI0020CF47CB|nr:hypothetical protein [Natrononativus amylolyticus]
MSETGDDVDKDALQEELGQIKQAMGLREAHPYWWRFWIVEGLGVGIIFPIMQLGLRDGFSPWIVALLVGVFVAHQLVLWRVLSAYERPTTGVPSWRTWHFVLFAGFGALLVGIRPFFDAIDPAQRLTLWLVVVASVFGVAYLYLGQLLAAYDIRRADCYAFYLGGAWILVLAAVIPYLSAIRGWEFAVFGIAYALYCIAAYVVLSRV